MRIFVYWMCIIAMLFVLFIGHSDWQLFELAKDTRDIVLGTVSSLFLLCAIAMVINHGGGVTGCLIGLLAVLWFIAGAFSFLSMWSIGGLQRHPEFFKITLFLPFFILWLPVSIKKRWWYEPE
jgi:hypothetical protein